MLTFFKNYPYINYPTDTGVVRMQDFMQVQAVDRTKLLEAGLLNTYDIEQGETAAHISNKLYGSPSFDWLIYLINNITDWYNDTPMGDDVLRMVAFQKYYFPVYNLVEDDGSYVFDAERTTEKVLERIDFIGDAFNNYQMSVDYDAEGNTMVFGPFAWVVDELLSDDPENPVLKPISCMQHEYTLNEAKRRIYVVRKDDLQRIVNSGLKDIRV